MATPTAVVDLTGDSSDDDVVEVAEKKSLPLRKRKVPPFECPLPPKKALHAPLKPPENSDSNDGNDSSDDRNEMRHPGELEVDWEGDFWTDHDERCHGTIDTNSNRREYPQGFKWSCCNKIGGEGGCEKGGDDFSARYPESVPSEPPSDDEGHSGELEVDWEGDVWADHDERCHGKIDTNSNRREHPEGFKWSCCGEPGDSPGCNL